MYRGQKEQTKNNDYDTTEREDKIIDSESCVNVREWCSCVNMGDKLLSMFVWMRAVKKEKGQKTGSRNYVHSSETCCVCVSLSLSFPISTTFVQF